jgi:hypothetical protein
MKTYTITHEQLMDLTHAVCLAEYFCEEHEGDSDQEQYLSDLETYKQAYSTIRTIMLKQLEIEK